MRKSAMPMCVQSQYSPVKHYLLSVLGRKRTNIVMFTVFIDDSGTAPHQSVAIASALIIPLDRLLALEDDWKRFKRMRAFPSFHTSACIAASEKEGFGGWTHTQIDRTVGGVRLLIKRYGAQIISFAVNKDDYDQAVPAKMRQLGGQYHYTWAIRHTLDSINHWAGSVGYTDPFLYIFDWMDPKADKKAKAEIETVMAQMEFDHPGFYEGKYDFKKRQDFPGSHELQRWAARYSGGRAPRDDGEVS